MQNYVIKIKITSYQLCAKVILKLFKDYYKRALVERENKMNKLVKHVIPACMFTVFVVWITGSAGAFVSNLSETCYRCLCHVATECDISNGCRGGYCGPFNISRIYWVEAGKVVMPDDDPERNHAWEDCARNYQCAKRIIEAYMMKLGKDCNGDGITTCYDYMMINGNGGYSCSAPLNRSVNGRRWLKRYAMCSGV